MKRGIAALQAKVLSADRLADKNFYPI